MNWLMLYQKFLRMYPRAYRDEYGDELSQTLADMLDHAPSRAARAAVWLRAGFDLPRSLATQHAQYAGQAIMRETPHYVRRNALLSLSLLLPFFIIVTVNDASAHHLYHTWLWNMGVFITWILLLPVLASWLSASTFIVWMRERRTSWRRAPRDLRHTWPIAAATVLSLLIVAIVMLRDAI